MTGTKNILVEFRKSKGWSQQFLALEADVSTRHISFIETGRSTPSRELLLKLAYTLELCHRNTNALLNAYGYAAQYTSMALTDTNLTPVRDALKLMLDNHAPFPAAVLDGQWNLAMANAPLQCMLETLLREQPTGEFNMLEATFDPNSLKPAIENWAEVASVLLRRLHLQVHSQPSPALQELYQKVLNMNPPENWRDTPAGFSEGPMLTAKIKAQGESLELFSTLSTFGTAQDVNLQELVIETYFPVNQKTTNFFYELAKR
ncbi:helix-turn-helix transcriptional regulator [Gilvimarinus sp. SDUM040013]|uniref:Helix-turn-helix transcriptional regulator n=1 Tax=Gilvimarinus gilvus TaxID=3058038 RepID=A0ABU4RWS7_9GAMM|nr:helix-turn-helix transcriptional regulator [Gilvimarinus sp. SDUM040013]MDO3386533.1 helix-turn-helix transcriptional regulator [Gilvimarinus sp. SDUM040013]MDX6849109.1 helix-turn-helix transcriptional regulator [Gilvimarinus sp. SDUM040013]